MDDTTTVVFESANFLGTSVRTTAKKLGMRTEASSRYEKGLDPHITFEAVQRACELVEMLNCRRRMRRHHRLRALRQGFENRSF